MSKETTTFPEIRSQGLIAFPGGFSCEIVVKFADDEKEIHYSEFDETVWLATAKTLRRIAKTMEHRHREEKTLSRRKIDPVSMEPSNQSETVHLPSKDVIDPFHVVGERHQVFPRT